MKHARRLSGKRVLITGGGGFVGSHLARALLAEGAVVHTLSRTKNPWRLRDIRGRIRHHVCPITSRVPLGRVIEGFRPGIVYHLAAPIPSRRPGARELRRVAVGGTRTLLDVSRHSGSISKLIVLGTADEYGKARESEENSRARPLTPYGIAKKSATDLLKRHVRSFRFSTIVIRAPIAYGPAQSFGMFIPNCIWSCLAREPFRIYGSRVARDFLYIDDLVEALLRTALVPLPKFSIVNVGGGKAISLSQLARMIARPLHAQHMLRVEAHPRSAQEPGRRYLRIGKAERVLHWSPRTSLRSGIETTVRWYRDHRKEFPHL